MEDSFEVAQLFAERYPYDGKSLSTDLDAVEKHVKSQFSDPENFAFEGKPVTNEVAAKICHGHRQQQNIMHNTRLTTLFSNPCRLPESTTPPPNSTRAPSSKA